MNVDLEKSYDVPVLKLFLVKIENLSLQSC
ncbi:hypothetical protein C7M40_03191 (plasmid) [Lactiplantibacillus plantarum]|nr:hypothetical protein C7M40_03191 [Lactiplantibacillus plantarum]